MKIAEKEFIEGLATFTHGVTINLKKREPKNKVYFRDEFAENTFDWFVMRLNQRLFGRSYRKGFKKIAVIGCFERGDCQRPHLHLAIACPEDVDSARLIGEIRTVHSRMEWRMGEVDINPQIDIGWIEYMSKHGFDKLFFN
jgi:hypothetical protein